MRAPSASRDGLPQSSRLRRRSAPRRGDPPLQDRRRRPPASSRRRANAEARPMSAGAPIEARAFDGAGRAARAGGGKIHRDALHAFLRGRARHPPASDRPRRARRRLARSLGSVGAERLDRPRAHRAAASARSPSASAARGSLLRRVDGRAAGVLLGTARPAAPRAIEATAKGEARACARGGVRCDPHAGLVRFGAAYGERPRDPRGRRTAALERPPRRFFSIRDRLANSRGVLLLAGCARRPRAARSRKPCFAAELARTLGARQAAELRPRCRGDADQQAALGDGADIAAAALGGGAAKRLREKRARGGRPRGCATARRMFRSG